MRIRIHSGSVSAIADLKDTPTVRKLIKILPCESQANTWGDEVYFEVNVKALLESDAKQVVEPGTLCFWVEGNSLAIPFGPTPVSHSDECRLVTRVNILGRINGDPKILKSIRDGDLIRVENENN